MQPTLNVYPLPRFVEPQKFAGGTAVVIDVLRATTTIVYAMAAGATRVIPCLEVSDAMAATARFPTGEALLGGEREGLAIENFQLGNSPEEYTPERVGGKTIVFTTTNGTRAMLHAQAADEILIASFVNASAVVRRLLESRLSLRESSAAFAERKATIPRRHVHILCAGADGRIGRDDVLLAGLLVERLGRQGIYQENSAAITAGENWLAAFPLPHALGTELIPLDRLAAELTDSIAGQNLTRLGLEADILAAAQIDRFDIVPRMAPKTMRIE